MNMHHVTVKTTDIYKKMCEVEPWESVKKNTSGSVCLFSVEIKKGEDEGKEIVTLKLWWAQKPMKGQSKHAACAAFYFRDQIFFILFLFF